MKKLLFLLVVLSGSAFISKAQTQISFGPKAGINLANWATKETPGVKMRTAFHAGGAVTIPVSRTIALQPELLYSKEGTKYDGGTYDVAYLNVPLLIRYQHASGFHAETGPQLGILLDVQLKDSEDEPADLEDYTNSTQSSWCIGMGFQFKPGLDLYTRYNVGISRVGPAPSKITGNVLGIGVAYMFRK